METKAKEALLFGLGVKLSEIRVPSLSQKETTVGSLPVFLDFISRQLELPILMITTGPRREQGIIFEENL